MSSLSPGTVSPWLNLILIVLWVVQSCSKLLLLIMFSLLYFFHLCNRESITRFLTCSSFHQKIALGPSVNIWFSFGLLSNSRTNLDLELDTPSALQRQEVYSILRNAAWSHRHPPHDAAGSLPRKFWFSAAFHWSTDHLTSHREKGLIQASFYSIESWLPIAKCTCENWLLVA